MVPLAVEMVTLKIETLTAASALVICPLEPPSHPKPLLPQASLWSVTGLLLFPLHLHLQLFWSRQAKGIKTRAQTLVLNGTCPCGPLSAPRTGRGWSPGTGRDMLVVLQVNTWAFLKPLRRGFLIAQVPDLS